jgi:hypothetical protein
MHYHHVDIVSLRQQEPVGTNACAQEANVFVVNQKQRHSLQRNTEHASKEKEKGQTSRRARMQESSKNASGTICTTKLKP